MPRCSSPSAIATIALCVMPEPAPGASARQADGDAGACQIPDTSPKPVTSIFKAVRPWRQG